ncbi:MAG: DUF6270 domain-containing protein [Corynebacterium sp.]
MAIPISIYGSCVSRDIIRVTGDKFKSNEYVARQCWISAVSLPQPAPEGINLTGFRLKSLIGDIESNALPRLTASAEKSKALVIDLASDRHGVWDLGNGSFLSNLATMKKQKVLRGYPDSRLIKFGSDEHLDLFDKAVSQVKTELEASGLFSKTTVLKIPFTDHDVDGNVLDFGSEGSPGEIQESYEPYFEIFRKNEFHFLPDLPEEYAVSTDDHAWGKGINHFVDEAYHWWGSEIENFINSGFGVGWVCRAV